MLVERIEMVEDDLDHRLKGQSRLRWVCIGPSLFAERHTASKSPRDAPVLQSSGAQKSEYLQEKTPQSQTTVHTRCFTWCRGLILSTR